MFIESIGLFICLLVLILIGIGPALWAVGPNTAGLNYALGISPALGFAIVGLIGFPLVRYVAPVRVWAGPVTIVLIAGSVIWAVAEWRRTQPARQPLQKQDIRAVAAEGGVVLLGFVVLASPLVLKGIQYAIFRSNPSDAFTFITLAETFRVAEWKVLWAGAPFHSENLEAMKRLAEVSPTALFNARVLLVHLSPGYPLVLSWAAQLVGIPVYRFYYAFNVLTLTTALPLAFLLSRLLNLPALLRYLATCATVLCFWTLFVLENDSGPQIAAIPLLLLAVVMWTFIERNVTSTSARACLLLAAASTAIVCVYYPVWLIILGAWACYYGAGLLQRAHTWRTLLVPLVVSALVLLILTITGQIDYFVGIFASSLNVAQQQKAFYPFGLELLRSDGLSAVWGFSDTILSGSFAAIIPAWLWGRLANEAGTFLSLAVVGALLFSARRTSPKAERIVLAMLLSGCVFSALFFWQDNGRASAKAFTYVYPFLIFAACLISNYLHLLFQPILRRVMLGVLGLWLAAQILLGGGMPYINNLGGIFRQTDISKPEQYDLEPIIEYLNSHKPELLLVDIPRTETWIFPYYTTFVFSRYPSYFQRGLIIDNSTTYQNMWLQDLTRVPDYAVVLKSTDYIAAEGLGVKVAETKELILYRVTSPRLSSFLEREESYKRQEQNKPVFPAWLSQGIGS